MIIGLVLLRWLPLHGEADRLLGSQKSRRFCQIAKSPTSFDPASITSGCRQPLMSAPASVPRVARPSEATAFARSGHPSPVPHTSLTLISSSTCCVQSPQLLTQYSSRYYRLSRVPVRWQMKGALCRVSFWEPTFGLRPVTYAGSPSGEARQALRQGADEGCPFGGLCRVSGCRLRVSFRGRI